MSPEPPIRVRAWEPADTTAMQELASRNWPNGPHPGGLGWELAIGQLASQVVVADRGSTGDGAGGRVAGWAGLTGSALVLQVDPACPDAAGSLVSWAVRTAAGPEMTVPVFDGDDVVCRALTAQGFAPQSDSAPVEGMFRRATSRGPVLPAGYRIRSVHAGELDRRVQAHRAAWLPSAMPWPPDGRPAVPADATSTFTMAHYEQVRRTWMYDEELDLVVEAPDGTLAACCIAWWDRTAGCAEIEPLGVVPEHRRRGLATAMCMEVAAQVAARGGDQVFINNSLNAHYPAPAQTYLTVGFEIVSLGRVYRRSA
jgi:GNAT superfamily N-acetyltransferase